MMRISCAFVPLGDYGDGRDTERAFLGIRHKTNQVPRSCLGSCRTPSIGARDYWRRDWSKRRWWLPVSRGRNEGHIILEKSAFVATCIKYPPNAW